jgi:heat shock protein HslJ
MARRALMFVLPVAAAFVGCEKSVTSPDGRSVPSGTWRLVSLQAGQAPAVAVAEPERYTAEFRGDGQLALRADCNQCGGSYKVDRQKLQIGQMACTLIFCGGASLDGQYLGLLRGATDWSESGGVLELRSSAGVLHFRR